MYSEQMRWDDIGPTATEPICFWKFFSFIPTTKGRVEMAFDAGMLACMVHEIRTVALGGRIEKVMQPERDEILLQLRSTEGGKRLLINAGTGPRMSFTELTRENPAQAPMFCMLLRKHLTGAKLSDIRQEGFERVVTLEFDTRDEMGFACTRRIVAEIMGKYSNIIFTDGEGKIISALKTVDFSTSSQRQVLPGMRYELPPAQDKDNPLTVTRERFHELYAAESPDKPLDKFILSRFCGISATVAREMVMLATRHTDTPVRYATAEEMWKGFDEVIARIREGNYAPTMVFDNGNAVEYAFCPLTHYTSPAETRSYDTASGMLDDFFATRDKESRIRQRAADVLRLLTNAESRIKKKLDIQRSELVDCEKADIYKKYGDMITANMWALQRGMKQAEIIDYECWDDEKGEYGTVIIELDERLTPSANAQKYYKKYTKARNAKVELARQIELGEAELAYIYTVFDALTRAETANDLAEIRDELYRSGYASRMKGYAAPKKQPAPTVAKFKTTNGFLVYCGKNNLQNEHITHKLADRNDYWFHAKGVPGSHV
ncbi:MAG: fibronectin/fibrinogen-binding protein, partial [Ruminococcaceae bacterium]|nr:fibronectin/fibrinogen-binding protein [Oscillospiraceae bacterium]